MAARKTKRKPKRDADRVLDLLWERAEAGSVTAQKVLYEHYRRGGSQDEQPESDWSAIYGDGNETAKVTPIRRRAG